MTTDTTATGSAGEQLPFQLPPITEYSSGYDTMAVRQRFETVTGILGTIGTSPQLQMPPPADNGSPPTDKAARREIIQSLLPAYRTIEQHPEVLAQPIIGRELREMARAVTEGDPGWELQVRYLHNIAATVMMSEGVGGDTPVVVFGDVVDIPGIGQAKLPGSTSNNQRTMAQLTFDGKNASIVDESGRDVTFQYRGNTQRTLGWKQFPAIEASSPPGETTARIQVDALSARRRPQELPLPSPSPEGTRPWELEIDGALKLLVHDHPGLFREIAPFAKTLVPLGINRSYTPQSASSGETVGSYEADTQGGATNMACTLVHELAGHNQLNAYLQMLNERGIRLTNPGHEVKEMLYAPWRDDPRHTIGRLHGDWSFLKIAQYWGERGAIEPPGSPQARLAQFEVGHWRLQLQIAVQQLLESPELLTPEGRQFYNQEIIPRLEDLSKLELPPDITAYAKRSAAYNRARWVAHHIKPDEATLESLVTHLEKYGLRAHPPPEFTEQLLLHTDKNAKNLNTLAYLSKHNIAPDICPIGPDIIKETTEADRVAFVDSDTPKAIRLYIETLSNKDTYDNPGAIVGLGFALRTKNPEDSAAQLLMTQPHLFRAVRKTLTPRSRESITPYSLAKWLSKRGNQRLAYAQTTDDIILEAVRQNSRREQSQ